MSDKQQHPLAMPSPNEALTLLTEPMLAQVLKASRNSPRKRMIYPLHKNDSDILQRMLNAVQPGSYIRPHRHASERGESLIVLRGVLVYFTFNDDGTLQSATRHEAGTTGFGVDIEGGVWHSFAALEPDTVLFEVKPGPYDPQTDKEFAPWAPQENSPNAAGYLNDLLKARSPAEKPAPH